MKFGASETIHTKSFDQALARKIAFKKEEAASDIVKTAESFIQLSEPQIIEKVIAEFKAIREGRSDFSVIELFSDENQVSRINICSMKETI